MSFLTKRWYALPALSGLLLMFAAPPFNVWPLVFVGLVALYWSVAALPVRTAKETFLSGGVAAGLYIFSLYYLTLFQFQWLPGSENLITLIRAGIVPATGVGAVLLGLAMLVYRRLRTGHIALNACLGGAAFLLLELPFDAFFQGYYPGVLAYIAAPLPYLMHVAVLGGTAFVSFVVAAASCLAAEILAAAAGGWSRTDTRNVAAFTCALVCVGALSAWFVGQSSPVERTVSVAIPQPGAYERIAFGVPAAGGFSFPAFSKQFSPASFGRADFIFYPQSFFDGFLYTAKDPPGGSIATAPNAQIGEWIQKTFPANAVLATWDSVLEARGAYNEYQFWKGGRVVGTYKKHDLHFLDNTSTWLGEAGLYQTKFFYAPAKAADGPLEIGGVSVGTAVCSEVMHNDVVRAQARGAQFLLLMGSEAGFLDDTIGNLSLRAAQYRAVEYGVPVVRADAVGPSAIIDQQGSIVALAPWHTSGVLQGSVPLRMPHITPYARFGAIPLYTLLALMLLGLAARRTYPTLYKTN